MFRRVLSRTPCFLSSSSSSRMRMMSSTPMLRCYADYESFQVATVRREAPQFTAKAVINGEINNLTLADYKGKYVVLLFYPLDFTFVCPTEITAFSDRAAEFEKLGAQVLAISVDSAYSHLAWTKQPRNQGGLGEMKIPLVADITKEISKDYGVLIDEEGIALRGLFIIDPKGTVRQITINDLPIGRSVDETLRLLQAVQWSDKNPGQVMPCGWTPGAATIKPAAANEYFEKKYI
eukprot:PhF_6_TR25839/c1_g1_i1/m.36504